MTQILRDIFSDYPTTHQHNIKKYFSKYKEKIMFSVYLSAVTISKH